ncbi:MAG: phosphoribosyl-ATP diphosphatase [Kiloniellales bacterium]
MAKTPPRESDARILDRLYAIIESRRGADPATSRTARLFRLGTKGIAQKLGEEAVETVLEAEHGAREKLVTESADLLYHLLVLWAHRGVRPQEVWAALADRMTPSGVAETAPRAKQ